MSDTAPTGARYSRANITTAVMTLEHALDSLRRLPERGVTEDVEAHYKLISDATMKHTVTVLSDALPKLRDLPADVEAHGRLLSDETIKTTIETIDDALTQLRDLPVRTADDDVEAHHFSASDETLKKTIATLEDAITALRAL